MKTDEQEGEWKGKRRKREREIEKTWEGQKTVEKYKNIRRRVYLQLFILFTITLCIYQGDGLYKAF